jgi:hypothetical protein
MVFIYVCICLRNSENISTAASSNVRKLHTCTQMCTYIYIYIYVYIYIYIYIYTKSNIYIYIRFLFLLLCICFMMRGPQSAPESSPTRDDFFGRGQSVLEHVGANIFQFNQEAGSESDKNTFRSFWCLPDIREQLSQLGQEFGLKPTRTAPVHSEAGHGNQSPAPGHDIIDNDIYIDEPGIDFSVSQATERKKAKFKLSSYDLSCLQGYYNSKMSRDDLDVFMLAQSDSRRRSYRANNSAFFHVDDGDHELLPVDEMDAEHLEVPISRSKAGLLYPGRALVTRFLRFASKSQEHFGMIKFLRCLKGCELVCVPSVREAKGFLSLNEAEAFVKAAAWSCTVCDGTKLGIFAYFSLGSQLKRWMTDPVVAQAFRKPMQIAHETVLTTQQLRSSSAAAAQGNAEHIGNYSFIGSKKFQNVTLPNANENTVFINVSIDGAQVLKRTSIVPILVQVLNLPVSIRYSREFLLCCGIFQHKKISDLDLSISPLLLELTQLGSKGATSGINMGATGRWRVLVHAFVMDSVAMGEVCATKAPRGMYGCGFCTIKGQHATSQNGKSEATSYFPMVKARDGSSSFIRSPALTLTSLREVSAAELPRAVGPRNAAVDAITFGQKEVPLVAFIPNCAFPNGFACYDKFHGHVNVQKKITKTILQGIKNVTEASNGDRITQYLGGLSPAQRHVVSSRASGMLVPHNFGRSPRDPVPNIKNFIGEEWTTFSHCFFTVLFFGVAGGLKHGSQKESIQMNINGIKMYYASVSLFSAHIYLSRINVCQEGLEICKERTKRSLRLFSKVSLKIMTPSMHSQTHGPDSISTFGPGNDMLLFERYMPILKGDTRSRLHVEAGIVNRLIGKAILQNFDSDVVKLLNNECKKIVSLDSSPSGEPAVAALNQSHDISKQMKAFLPTSGLHLDSGSHYFDTKLPADAIETKLVDNIKFLPQTEDLAWVRRKVKACTDKSSQDLQVHFFGRMFTFGETDSIGNKERFQYKFSVINSALGHELRFQQNPKLDVARTSHFRLVHITDPTTDEASFVAAEIVSFLFAGYGGELYPIKTKKTKNRNQKSHYKRKAKVSLSSTSSSSSNSSADLAEPTSSSSADRDSDYSESSSSLCARGKRKKQSIPASRGFAVNPVKPGTPVCTDDVENRIFVLVRYVNEIQVPHAKELTRHTPSISDPRLDELLSFLQNHFSELHKGSFFQDKKSLMAAIKAAKKHKVPLVPFLFGDVPVNGFAPARETQGANAGRDSWDVLPVTAIGDPLTCTPFGYKNSKHDGHPKYAGKSFIALTRAFPKAVQPNQGLKFLQAGV